MIGDREQELLAAVRDRFGCRDVSLDEDALWCTAKATLPPRAYMVAPGIQELRRIKDPGDTDWLEVRLPEEQYYSPGDDDDLLGLLQTAMLRMTRHQALVELTVVKRLPRRYSRSRRWKRFPPSRRRRMASWRRTPDHIKAQYAPLAGLPRWRWPGWARHPDPTSRQLGKALVRQEWRVYAMPEADIEELLRQASDEWICETRERLQE